jgi:predicted RecA/RadA family phage recombinase
MATNYVQPGDSIKYSNSGSAISSGDIVAVGNRIGIAVTDIAATTGEGTVSFKGVYTVAKDADESFAVGDALFYDSSDSTVTKTAIGNKWAGMAYAAADTADTTCEILLCPLLPKAAVVSFSAGTNLTAVSPAETTLSDLSTGGGNTYTDAAVNAIFDEVQTALNLKSDNADIETLRAEVETRLDAIDTGIAAILTALKNAGLMANA